MQSAKEDQLCTQISGTHISLTCPPIRVLLKPGSVFLLTDTLLTISEFNFRRIVKPVVSFSRGKDYMYTVFRLT